MTNVIVDQESEDPLVSFNFMLEIQGQVTGFFTEVGGLGSTTETTDHAVVTPTGQQVIKKVPGRLKWEDMTFKRGITTNMDIWEWRKMVEQGMVEGARRNGSVVMYNQAGEEVARWNFQRAWPASISGPAPKSDSNDIGVEELKVVHEYIERVN
jgi:phage tail-like protein